MKEADKKSPEELVALLAQCPANGCPFRHYKTGALYWTCGRAIAEATQEPLVIYHRQNSEITFARPLSEWMELVEWQGEKVPRFQPARAKKP